MSIEALAGIVADDEQRCRAGGRRPPSGGRPPTPLAWRAFRHFAYRYAKTWRGSLTMSVIYPTLYLAAMGVGLGTLVDHHVAGLPGGLHGVSGARLLEGVRYLAFVAPGLLAASSMQIAVSESTWPVYGALRFDGTYPSMLASPIRIRDALVGHLGFVTLRLATTDAAFLAIMAAFSAIGSPEAALALPLGVLTGLTFSTWLFAFSIGRSSERSFSILQRLVVVPLFLFSGSFYPVGELPGWMQPVALATPLYHGVALCRAATLGHLVALSTLGHLVYLVLLAGSGLVAASRAYLRRLGT